MTPVDVAERDLYVRITCRGAWPSCGRLACLPSVCPRHWRAGGAALMDVRGIVMKTAEDYVRLREHCQRWAERQTDIPRLAVLGAPGMSYGIARMIVASWPAAHPLAAFDTEAAALHWLLAGDRGDGLADASRPLPLRA